MSTTIVLPTYNERDNIAGVLSSIRRLLPDAHVMVIDDGSPDGTAEIAQEIAGRLGGIEVLNRKSKDGLGSAYRFGFERIFGTSDLDDDHVVVTMDSDFSHDPAVIPTMLERIADGADAVIGSRYVDGGGTMNWPLYRRALSRWGNVYTSWILKIPVRDCTSGFRAYRLSALKLIEPSSTTAEGYAFLTELVLRLINKGKRVDEVPIMFVDRTMGTSKMSTRIIVESMTLVSRWGLARRFKFGANTAQL